MTGETVRLALFGGIYNNYLALQAAALDARQRGVDAMYCLGDLGAFGPHPDRVFPLLAQFGIQCVQGNYDDSIGNQLDNCQCGYTDPRDNYFAQVSYDYTLAKTSAVYREYLRSLPREIRLSYFGRTILLCHGSPRRTNEFLWESTSSAQFLSWLLTAQQADVVCATHTGLKWYRRLEPDRHWVNVGVLGRPENDGTTNVWYTLLELDRREVRVEFIPVVYDHDRLATEMREEKLPEEFVETIQTGWWTTCLEILPAKERLRGRW